jgi:hypothetical protein
MVAGSSGFLVAPPINESQVTSKPAMPRCEDVEKALQDVECPCPTAADASPS